MTDDRIAVESAQGRFWDRGDPVACIALSVVALFAVRGHAHGGRRAKSSTADPC